MFLMQTGKTVNCVFCEMYRPDARDAIVDICTEYNASLLVIGKRGLGSLKSLVLGSVSNYVVQHAPCTVIVFDQEKEKIMAEMEHARVKGLQRTSKGGNFFPVPMPEHLPEGVPSDVLFVDPSKKQIVPKGLLNLI